MKKSPKSKSTAAPKIDPYLEGLVSKLIDRLVQLEKKLDTVILQTSGKTSSGSVESGKPQQSPPPVRRDRTLYEAICAQCSKVCEVPFKPVEGRAVYCKECWAQRKSGATPNGMPILTPVALPPKPASKLHALFTPSAPAVSATKKPKKKKLSGSKKKR